MGEGEGEGDQENISADHEGELVLGERGPARRLVEPPGEREATTLNSAGLQRREVHHRFVDQEQVGIEVIDHDDEGEAGQPGGIGFPIEPGELVGHLGRRHQVFEDVVEAAAVDLPGFAMDPLGQFLARFQAEIEVDEIERAADPTHGRDHVEPAEDQAGPFGDD